jgi:hypothetical protein
MNGLPCRSSSAFIRDELRKPRLIDGSEVMAIDLEAEELDFRSDLENVRNMVA